VSPPIRVVLVEDNDVFRESLELLLALRGDLMIVGSEPDGSHIVEVCRTQAADVVVVDYRLPGLDGVEVTQAVRSGCPEVAVVALTAAAGEREAEALLAAGAVACVRKDEPLETIVTAIRKAAGREPAVA
jgi:DNA-binding NarL/FixJ family response regulator